MYIYTHKRIVLITILTEINLKKYSKIFFFKLH